MAERIPTMNSPCVYDFLDQVAAWYEGLGYVVECGTWLGAATRRLGDALLDRGWTGFSEDLGPRIFCFDRFTATSCEVKKAAAQGVELKESQDTRPLVRENLRGLGVQLIQGGDGTWSWPRERPIGILLVDAAKGRFWRIRELFFESLLTGAVVGLLDYHYPSCRDEREWVAAHPSVFDKLIDFPGKSSAAFFRVRQPGYMPNFRADELTRRGKSTTVD